jgi:hypothetical protein
VDSFERYSTVQLRSPKAFQDQTLWPEYLALSQELDAHLDELTTRVIREAIDDDVSEPAEQAPPRGAAGAERRLMRLARGRACRPPDTAAPPLSMPSAYVSRRWLTLHGRAPFREFREGRRTQARGMKATAKAWAERVRAWR